MDADDLTAKTARDGPVCTPILSGHLDLLQPGGFLEQAALAVDDLTERLGFGLAGVLFLNCAGARALRVATRSAPGGYPVTIGSPSAIGLHLISLYEIGGTEAVSHLPLRVSLAHRGASP
jgi:hypothetical protein